MRVMRPQSDTAALPPAERSLFRRILLLATCATLLLPFASGTPSAQQAGQRVFHVRETAGIRRTEYPVSVRLQLPRGALADATQTRLTTNSAEVPAQFSASTAWDDGSVRALDVDFNTSLNPEEDRRFELQFGPGTTAAPLQVRGLTVTEEAGRVVVGNLAFSKSGSPFLASATYRGEGIGSGANGLTLTDSAGRRHDLSKAQNASLDVVKGGPLLVVLRYTASIPLDDTTSIPVDMLLEMPNSKTWLKTTATVTDRARKLRDVAIERPYVFGGFPALWDFGTDSGTYGVFRAATDVVTLTQTSTVSGPTGWRIETGTGTQLRPLETSAGARNKSAGGWGHVQDAKAVVAFAVGGFARDAGTYTITFAGSGQATYRFAPAAASGQLQLVVYEHFVGTPVAIGAATNPTAMLTAPAVTIER